ncbi:MAG: tetratricopeptide repeat-containing sensor histidine kinase [Bacteroidales bacterium]|nr:tetratricopeptide repeat-containing sensor histidine kinase [Bacteroidales bacterium]
MHIGLFSGIINPSTGEVCRVLMMGLFLIWHMAVASSHRPVPDSLTPDHNNFPGEDQGEVLRDLAEYYVAEQPDIAMKYIAQWLKSNGMGEEDHAKAFKLMGDAFYYKQDYFNAIIYYDSAAQVSMAVYGEQSMQYAERLGDMGYCHTQLIQNDQAIQNFNQALAISRINGHQEEIANNLNNIGKVHFDWGNFDSAIYYFRSALQVDRQLGNSSYIGVDLNNIAKVYEAWGKLSEAIAYYRESLNIALSAGEEGSAAIRYSNIGNIHKQKGQLDSAWFYYKKSLEIDRRAGNDNKIGVRLSRLGEILMLQEEYAQAAKYFNDALDIFGRTSDPESKALVIVQLGKLNRLKGAGHRAEQYYLESLNLADSLGLKAITLSVYQEMSLLFEKSRELGRSLAYLKKYSDLKDVIFREEHQRQLAEFQARYETGKKQMEIERLNSEKDIHESELKRSENLRFFFIVISILTIILAALLYSRYRFKIRTNRLLTGKNEELQVLNATKDKFFSIIAHDLKNPLSGFISISQALSENIENLSPDEIRYFTRELHRSSRQLYELLQNLLQWARSQTGTLKYNPEAKDIHTLVEENFSLLLENARKKQINLVNETQPQTMIYADPNMVHTVLRNLITNAIKFSGPNGRVVIRSRREEDKVKVIVSDTGIGIDAEDIPKLFRIDIDTSKIGISPEKGTGLGLILCKELIARNSGDITVDSKAGKGTTFIFTLPSQN